jgi:hypothetical protein
VSFMPDPERLPAGDKDISPTNDCMPMAEVAPKRQFVKDLKEGEEVDSTFSVKFKKPIRKYARGFMFELRLSDHRQVLGAKRRRRGAESV